MEKGTIPKVLDYYLTKPQFKEELFRALREFFNKPKLEAGGKLEMNEGDDALFNEWFIFDFKLSNGKTPLEDFYEKNPYNLDIIKMQTYEDLQDNQFGIYKVKNVRLGEELTLENLQTAKVYRVREYAATFGLKVGQVFSARVGKVGDHYEMVGGNPSFGPVTLDANLENLFRKDKKILTPKTLRASLGGGGKPKNTKENFPSPEEAETDFKNVLMRYGLDKFVTVETIKEWIYNRSRENPFPLELNMLWSLLYPDMKDYNNALTEIIKSFNTFYNLCPQKELGDKSPFEKREECEKKEIPPDPLMSITKFPASDWGKKYHGGLEYMKQAQFKKATKKFNEVFSYLLKHKITYPEIYRLYANKGVCHLALNEPAIGWFMLKISAEINPLYDFAKQQLAKYREGDFVKAEKTKKEQDVIHDIGYQYYQFLKPFNLNFIHAPHDSHVENTKK